MGSGHLKESNCRRSFMRRSPGTATFFREIVLHATAVFRGYNIHVHVHVCKSKLFLNPFTARVLDGVFYGDSNF